MMLLPTLREIQDYTHDVEKKQVRCDLTYCPRCGKPASFKLHDRRKRTYLVLVNRLVKTIRSLLARWKCQRCRQSFTLYPPFALRQKRYLSEEILRRAERYVARDRESYRSAVKIDGMAVFHEGSGEKIDERSLAHSTLYRWLGTLGSMAESCRRALGLIREKAPGSEVFRRILPIAVWKYRSEARRRVLGDCRRFLVAEGEFRQIFGISIFPRLATLCRWH
jgi:transposase-like protein